MTERAPGPIRRAIRRLLASGGPAGEEDGTRVVELTRVPSEAEANAIVRDLEAAGITATVFGADAMGAYPQRGLVQGARVMVLARDLDRARPLLSPVGGLAEVRPQPRVRAKRRTGGAGGSGAGDPGSGA